MISFDLTSAETQRSCRVQRRREMIKTELAGDDSCSLLELNEGTRLKRHETSQEAAAIKLQCY